MTRVYEVWTLQKDIVIKRIESRLIVCRKHNIEKYLNHIGKGRRAGMNVVFAIKKIAPNAILSLRNLAASKVFLNDRTPWIPNGNTASPE